MLKRKKSASICIDCLDDEILKKRFEKYQSTECAVCGKSNSPSVKSLILAKISRKVILDYFEIYDDIYPGYNGLSLSKVVGSVIGCDNLSFCDLVSSHLIVSQDSSINDEDFFKEDQEYSKRTIPFESEEEQEEYHIARWRSVELSLTHRQRYFNDDAEQFFKMLFEVIADATHPTLLNGPIPS